MPASTGISNGESQPSESTGKKNHCARSDSAAMEKAMRFRVRVTGVATPPRWRRRGGDGHPNHGLVIGPHMATRFLPARLARYIASSAARNSEEESTASCGNVATPQLRPGWTRTLSFV